MSVTSANVVGGDRGDPAQVVGERGAAVDVPGDEPGHDPLPPARAPGYLEGLDDLGPGAAGSRVTRQSLLSTNSGVGMVRQAI